MQYNIWYNINGNALSFPFYLNEWDCRGTKEWVILSSPDIAPRRSPSEYSPHMYTFPFLYSVYIYYTYTWYRTRKRARIICARARKDEMSAQPVGFLRSAGSL